MSIGYDFLSFLESQAGDDRAAIGDSREGAEAGALERGPSRTGSRCSKPRTASPRPRPRCSSPSWIADDPEIWNSLGIAKASGGDLEGALEAFRGALSADPKNSEAYQNMGIALLQAGRNREAIDAFEKAFALDEKLPRAWNAYGVALERSGRGSAAIDAWKKAYALDPEQFDALYNIALVAARVRGSSDGTRRPGEVHRARAVPALRGGNRSRAPAARGSVALKRVLAAAAILAAGGIFGGLAGCRKSSDRFPGAPVVLISIDTLRADHLPAYGYKDVATPALDSLRERFHPLRQRDQPRSADSAVAHDDPDRAPSVPERDSR